MDSELLLIVDDFDQKQKSGTQTPLTDTQLQSLQSITVVGWEGAGGGLNEKLQNDALKHAIHWDVLSQIFLSSSSLPSALSIRDRVCEKVADGSRQFHCSCLQTA